MKEKMTALLIVLSYGGCEEDRRMYEQQDGVWMVTDGGWSDDKGLWFSFISWWKCK